MIARIRIRPARLPILTVLLAAFAVATHATPPGDRPLPKWMPRYSSSTLGRAWRAAWSRVIERGATPTAVAVERQVARVTSYSKGEAKADENTKKGKTSTGVELRPATATQIGVAAGSPEDVGKYVQVGQGDERRVYLVADSGTALVTREADTEKTGKVIDLYTPAGQAWPSNLEVAIIAVAGPEHYLLTPPADRAKFLSWETFERFRGMVKRG